MEKTQTIKGENISMKLFKTKLADLESFGFQIPENLKHLKKVELDEFVLTNKSQTKFVRLLGDTEKSRFFSSVDCREACLTEVIISEMLTDDEYENGLTYAELEEKNKQYLNSQLKKLSKKVWYQRESPLAKVLQGETVDIPDSMHIERSSICLKTIKTTVEELKNSGIKVPFGLEGRLMIDEIALTTPNEKYFFLLRKPEFIRKEKTHSLHNQLILDSYEAYQFYHLFGENIKKGAIFKTLKDTNKKYIESQLQKMAELERV